MADETADESRTEQLVVVMRHVNKELEVSEDVLGMYSMKECNVAPLPTQSLLSCFAVVWTFKTAGVKRTMEHLLCWVQNPASVVILMN